LGRNTQGKVYHWQVHSLSTVKQSGRLRLEAGRELGAMETRVIAVWSAIEEKSYDDPEHGEGLGKTW